MPDTLERFEFFARAYYLATGRQLPGKDSVVEGAASRAVEYDRWADQHGRVADAFLKAFDEFCARQST